MKKRLVVLSTAVLAATLAMPAFAADDGRYDEEKAQLRPDFSITMDGREQNFKTSSGDAVYPILYEGRTYLPLRSIGELMGKNVNWDEDDKTISIGGTRKSTSSNRENADIGSRTIYVQERPDFTIVVDGKERRFYTKDGDRLYPILYKGSTYLPLRSIGELMDSTVVWDADSKTVILDRDYVVDDEDYTVTDADSFNTVAPESDKAEQQQGYIGVGPARQIALEEVNLYFDRYFNSGALKMNDVTFQRTKRSYDDSKDCWVYVVQFYTEDAAYEVVVNARTGDVLDFDDELDNWARPVAKNDIGTKKAIQIALKDAGVKEKDVSELSVDYETAKNGNYYEVEFENNNMEYEYKLDAKTGKILEREKERED